MLGATLLREGEPTLLRLKNTWIIIHKGGGPTDDKPEVVASPPKDLNTLSSFLNLRVADMKRCYEPLAFAWSTIHGPSRRFMQPRSVATCAAGRNLIEVGETTTTPTPLELYR